MTKNDASLCLINPKSVVEHTEEHVSCRWGIEQESYQQDMTSYFYEGEKWGVSYGIERVLHSQKKQLTPLM